MLLRGCRQSLLFFLSTKQEVKILSSSQSLRVMDKKQENIKYKGIFYSSPPRRCVENIIFGTCPSNFTCYVCLTCKMIHLAKSVKSDRHF